jgi:TorA maturation chaperone TorD
MRDMSRLGSQRGYIYGFLTTVYRKELTPELLDKLRDSEFLEALIGIGSLLRDELSTVPAERLLENLEVEYARLFLGPARHVSPHDSVHLERDDGESGTLWGESTVEIKRLVESLGLKFKEDDGSISDHISVEMELMQKIIARESRAWSEGDREGALRCLTVEKKFLEDHLCKWIPQFYEKVAAQAESQFYKGIAKLTMEFVEFERDNLDSYVNT